MNLEKRYLDLARKVTKDVETMRQHLEVIKNEASKEHYSPEEKEYYSNWYNWLAPSLTTLEQARTAMRSFYETNYPESEPIDDSEKPKLTKKTRKK